MEVNQMEEPPSPLEQLGLALDEADALLAALDDGSMLPLVALDAEIARISPPQLETPTVQVHSAHSKHQQQRPMSKRERERQELEFLRVHSKELGRKLEKLQSSIAFGRRLNSRQSIWRHIARRHLAERRTAESENSRLRSELARHLRFAREIEDKARRSGEDRRRQRGAASARQLEDRDHVVLNQLVAELDLAYGLIDTVLPRNSSSSSANAVGTTFYTERKTQLVDGTSADLAWVELRDERVMPFDVRQVIDAMWRSWVVWYSGNSNINAGTWSSSRGYDGIDLPERTLALKFRLRTFKPDQTPVYLHEKVTVRKYLDRDRLVLVWRSMSEGEKGFAGLSTDETEWVIVERARAGSDRSVHSQREQDFAVIRSCVRIVPTGSSNCAAKDRRAFTNLVIKSYEDDANFALREMESMLLRPSRRALS